MEADDDDEEVDKDKGDCEEGRIDGDDVVRVDDMRKAIVCEGGNDFVDGGDEEEPALDEVCLAEKLDGAVGLAPVEDSALESEFLEELADDELYRDSVYGDKVYGYSAYGDEVYGDGVYGEGVYGERVYGDGVYGEGVYGDSVYGDWLYGDGVYGDGVYGVGVYGDGLYDKSFKIGELRCTIGVDAAGKGSRKWFYTNVTDETVRGEWTGESYPFAYRRNGQCIGACVCR